MTNSSTPAQASATTRDIRLTQTEADLLTDWRTPVIDRLFLLMSSAERSRLMLSLHTASDQLEPLAPTVALAGHGKTLTSHGKPIALPAADVVPNSFVVVLAEGSKCVAGCGQVRDGCTMTEALAETLEVSLAELPHALSPIEVVTSLRQVVSERGHTPVAPKQLRTFEFNLGATLGMLLRVMPDAVRVHLGNYVEQMRSQSLCPAIILLFGPASSGAKDQFSMFGPVVLPLAPYLESLADDMEQG